MHCRLKMSRETYQEVKSFIRDIGFPIAVAVWLLFEAHTTLNQLNNTMVSIQYTLSEMVTDHKELLKELQKRGVKSID